MRILEILEKKVHVEVRRYDLETFFDEQLSKFGAWEAFFVHDVPVHFLLRNITHLPLYPPPPKSCPNP